VLASQDGFLEHLKWLRRAVTAAGAEFLVAGDTLHALVRQGDAQWLLHPQFVTVVAGSARRTPRLHDETTRFAGWRPYASRTWDLSADRAAFRSAVRATEALAPELSSEPPRDGASFVASWLSPWEGRRVEGPFRGAAERPLDAARAERYEPYVRGDLLEVWFWGGTPLCAEREALPAVVGDGAMSVRELLVRAAALDRRPEAERDALLARCERVLRHDGATLAAVLPRGARQPVDVGYGASPLHGGRELLDLSARPEPEWLAPLRAAGRALADGLPDGVGAAMLFSIDAILDVEGRPWLLDLDCNPVVPPLAYGPMISTLAASARPRPAGETARAASALDPRPSAG